MGPHEMPLRHGLSLGELCCLVAAERDLDLDLLVVSARGWEGQEFAETGLAWVPPSPNIAVFGYGPGVSRTGAAGGG